jgi:hypothetical protein
MENIFNVIGLFFMFVIVMPALIYFGLLVIAPKKTPKETLLAEIFIALSILFPFFIKTMCGEFSTKIFTVISVVSLGFILHKYRIFRKTYSKSN